MRKRKDGKCHKCNERAVDNGYCPTHQPHPDAIPAHHIQWFEELKKACFNGDLALLSCKDAETDEPRSVICAVHQNNGEFVLTPFGHLCPKDNPFEAYTPPEA